MLQVTPDSLPKVCQKFLGSTGDVKSSIVVKQHYTASQSSSPPALGEAVFLVLHNNFLSWCLSYVPWNPSAVSPDLPNENNETWTMKFNIPPYLLDILKKLTSIVDHWPRYHRAQQLRFRHFSVKGLSALPKEYESKGFSIEPSP